MAQVKLRTRWAGRYELGANELAASNYPLRDALEQAGCLETSSAGKQGYWLRANKNRNAGGLRSWDSCKEPRASQASARRQR